MQQNQTITELHSAFRAFDESAGPQGLYAAYEYPAGSEPKPGNLAEWQFILRPAIERLGYEASKSAIWNLKEGQFHGHREGKCLNLELARISQIKVRLYGDTYRLDPHVDFAERWKQLRLATRIRSQAGAHSTSESVLFLIAFAKNARALDRELSQLHEELGVTERSAVYTQEQWPDPHGRHFETLCASWYWPAHSYES